MVKAEKNSSGVGDESPRPALESGTGESGACETPWEDLRAGALRGYEEVSAAAHSWHSVIPKAINFYFDNYRSFHSVEPNCKREFEYCPTCGGDLDTGWECNKCGLDWRDWVLMPPVIETASEQ